VGFCPLHLPRADQPTQRPRNNWRPPCLLRLPPLPRRRSDNLTDRESHATHGFNFPPAPRPGRACCSHCHCQPRASRAQEGLKKGPNHRARVQEKQYLEVLKDICISCISSSCILLLVPRKSLGVALDLLALVASLLRLLHPLATSSR